MSFESVRISFKALCSRRWGTEVSEQEVEKYTALLASLRPFLEVNTVTALNNNEIYALFQSFDCAFDPTKCFHWSIVSLCIDFLEVIVTRMETLADIPVEKIETYTSILLEHNEPRIRTSVTNLIKVLCAKASPEVDSLYTRLIPMFLNGVHQNWQRSSTTRDAVLGTEKQILLDDTTGWNHLESYVRALHAVFVGISRHSVSNAMKHLQNHSLILPTKDYHSMFPPYNHTDSLLSDLLSIADTDSTTDTIRVNCAELLFTHASQHLNRHIRELTFRFIADLLALAPTSSVNVGAYDMPSRGVQMTDVFPRMPGAALPYRPEPLPVPQMPTTPPPVLVPTTTASAPEPMWHTNTDYHTIARRIANALVTGLQDDWSQIRHAASMACQSFLVSLTTDTTNNNANSDVSNSVHSPLLFLYWSALLPRLCMNRFYPAVSVQTVSQATWRDILGPNALGRQLISQHAQSVVAYYISMTSARNHMTAEAACQAIAEFIQRMEFSVVNSHIPMLLDALLDCLRDDRWPVRDAAIVASSMITRYYATNTVTIEALPTLLHLWQENLTDFIWSIREHAAMAFAEAVQCTNSVNIDNTTMASNGDIVEKASTAVSKQQSLVIQTALHYIRTHQLYALESSIERRDISLKRVTISDPTTTSAVSIAGGSKPTKGPAAFSFLPQSLLDADAAAKAKKLQKETDSATKSNTTSNTTTSADSTANANFLSTAETVADSTSTNDTHHSKNKDRKGWGCCIDCVELRTCLPWEVTHGAVYLLREMAIVDPSVLFEVYTRNNDGSSVSVDTTTYDRVGDSLKDDGTAENTIAFDSQNTLLSKLFSLLSESILSATTAASDPTLSKETSPTGKSEAELLIVAVYEEVPIFLSTALQWVKQCLPDEERVRFFYSQLPMETLFSSLTRDLKASVSQDGTAAVSAPKYTTTTYGADGSVSTSMTSGYKSNTSNISSSANNSVQVGGTSVSNSSAVNRRNQQVARRSARNRDKVVIAAERCLTRVLDLLCSAEVRVVMEIVYRANVSTNRAVASGVLGEAQLQDSLLDNFSEDMRAYVKNMMKW